jgi:hypothetical protein
MSEALKVADQQAQEEFSGLLSEVWKLREPGQLIEHAAFEHIHHKNDATTPLPVDFAKKLAQLRHDHDETPKEQIKQDIFARMLDHAVYLKQKFPDNESEIRRRIMMWRPILWKELPPESIDI